MLVLAVGVLMYWIAVLLVMIFNVQQTLVGVIWELTMLPALAVLILLPVYCLVRLASGKLTDRRPYALAIAVALPIILLLAAAIYYDWNPWV